MSGSSLPLAGWRVLVPRGGAWGEGLADILVAAGAEAAVAPLLRFAVPEDEGALDQALERLAAGEYEWLLVTSATTVEVLHDRGAVVPDTTRVAVVGERTADAARAAGYRVDFFPEDDQSASGMVRDWLDVGAVRALFPVSELAESTLSDGLASRGVEIERVTAYRSEAVPAPAGLAGDVAAGRFGAILVTAGSVAERVAAEFSVIPETTRIVCIGPRTAEAATAAGLPVHAVALERSREAMVEALVRLTEGDS